MPPSKHSQRPEYRRVTRERAMEKIGVHLLFFPDFENNINVGRGAPPVLCYIDGIHVLHRTARGVPIRPQALCAGAGIGAGRGQGIRFAGIRLA